MIHLVGRRGAGTRLGGDALQMEETAELLRARGHRAEVAEASVRPGRGDVLHLHNIQRVLDWGDLPERARRAGARVVLTPLYHPTDRYHRSGRRGVDAGLARLIPDPDVFAGLRWGRTGGLKERALEVLRGADRVVLVHPDERALLERDLGAFGSPTAVVPVAIPSVAPEPVSAPFEGPFVLCAGRLEPLKNPAAVLEACLVVGVPVAFVGPSAGLRHGAYGTALRAAVRRAGPERARILGELPRGQVLGLMGLARAHVLASWTEVVGRVTLEAAAAGAAVVLTDVGFAPRYLEGTDAIVVPVGDVDALAAGIRRAIAQRPGPGGSAARRVTQRFTWNAVADDAVAAIVGEAA